MKEKEVDFYLHLANVLALTLVGVGAVLYGEIKEDSISFSFSWIEIMFLTLLVLFTISCYVYAYRIIKGSNQ